MAKQIDPTIRSQSKNPMSGVRAELPPEDERPFAEIRKSLYDALRLITLHRWAFFVPFCVVSCAAFILSLSYPRTYRATTSFERKNDPVMMNLPMSSGAASFKYFRNTMVQDLTSVDNMVEVVENLKMTKDFEHDADGSLTASSKRRRVSLARSLGGMLNISTSSPSEHIDIISITYTGPDPTIGKKLVDEVKRTYIRRTMSWIHEFLTSQYDYFSQEADIALTKVKKFQREDTALRLENPHVDPVNPASIAMRLNQLESEQRELKMREREYQAELDASESQLAGLQRIPNQIKREKTTTGKLSNLSWKHLSSQAMKIRHQMEAIDNKINDLQLTRGMTIEHPEIVVLNKQRRTIEKQLRLQQQEDEGNEIWKNSEEGSNPVLTTQITPLDPIQAARHSQLLAQIGAQRAKLKDVTISLVTNRLSVEQLQTAKREVFQKQEAFADVNGKVSQARQQYKQLQSTLANIEPAIKAIEQNRLLQFSEGQPARGSSIPVSPSSSTVVILALLAGLATGVVFVIMAEVFDHVYRSSSQVARSLGLPMLDSIDEIITRANRRSLFLKHAVINPFIIGSFLLLIALTGSMAYLSIEQPWTYEQMKKIPEAALHLFASDDTTLDLSAIIG